MTKKTTFKLFLAVLGLSLCQSAAAQISLGFRGGILVTSIDKSPLEDGEPKPENIPGFQIAVPVEIGLGALFAIQPEIMIGTHGARQTVNTDVTQLGIRTVTAAEIKYKITTVEIPVLAKLKFGNDVLRFQVLAGPSLGFGFNGKSKFESTITATVVGGTELFQQNTKDEFDAKFVKDGFKAGAVEADEFAVSKINFNVHFGAGLSVNLGGPNLFLDARYMLGMNDLRPEADGDTKEISYKSKRIGVSIGIMFPL
jgi:hypothetical protein